MTAVAVHAMSEQEARRLTERIRSSLDRVSAAWAELGQQIKEAYERRADLALKYGSWAEYADAELRPDGLAADVRRQLVGMLSEAGMSTRAIAPTVGVSQQAVAKSLRSIGDNRVVTSPPIRGLDGKTYTRPEPQPQPERDVSADLDVINDIRLYFNAIASSPQVAGLTPKGKQHIIDAANNLITKLQRNQ